MARQFKVGRETLRQHIRTHLPVDLATGLPRVATVPQVVTKQEGLPTDPLPRDSSSPNILELAEQCTREALAVLGEAKTGKGIRDRRLVLAAISTLQKQQELWARFAELWQQASQGAERECVIVKSLLSDPEGADLAARLVERLGRLDAGEAEPR